MFAIVSDGGRQYQIEEGKVIDVDFCDSLGVGDAFEFKAILLCSDNAMLIDSKTVKIKSKVISHGKGKKLIAFRKQRRTSCFEKRRGFRRRYTTVLIESVKVSS